MAFLHGLFEAQADSRPDAAALIGSDQVLSYKQLDGQANQLARCLREHGARPGVLVALYCERGAGAIVSILACLKAGAGYVPIDPTCPADRVRHILDEAAPVLLLADSALAARGREVFSGPVIVPGERAAEIAALSDARLLPEEVAGASPQDLAYVLYTSGTTGRPKGVMAEHRHVCLFVHAFNQVCATGPDDRVYQGFSLGFDGSVEEMWMAFSNGSALVCGGPDTPRMGDDLGRFLAQSGVTYLSTVPTMLSTITCPIPSLRLLVVSGEACPPELVARWVRPGLRMLNVYGPTEATVNTTAAECQPGEPITIGRALPGYELHILDEHQRPVRRGDKGELFVGGPTLARGYLNQPALSAERFLSVPGIAQGARLYRTGDLVRENEQGELEFFGRIDSQVKIRGYRVELAEIESVLLEQGLVRSASVKLVERDGLQELAAYVIARDPALPVDRQALLGHLEMRLPPYMIPAYLDQVDELPMLASGKVDRGRLPAPECVLQRAARQQVAPDTALERQIAGVWARTFGLPPGSQVSVEDDFFHDLGGYSLRAAQMVTVLRKETGKQVAIRDAYRFPTVRLLAAHLSAQPEPVAAVAGAPAERAALSAEGVFLAQPWTVRLATAALQGAAQYLIYGLGAVPLVALFLLCRGYLHGQLALSRFIGLELLVVALTWPTLLLLGIAAKWLLIGRYRAGRYPLWGFCHFRFWLVSRLQALSGPGGLAGTPLLPLYCRLMGAQVGPGCHLDSAGCFAWDLLRIGAHTSIGADTQMLGYRVEGGMLIIDGIDIGSRCFVGIHSALGLGVRMKDEARLGDQSLLADGQTIGAGEGWRGSPARPGPVPLPGPLSSRTADGVLPVRRPVLFGILHLLLLHVLSLVFLLPLLPLLGLLPWAVLARQGRVALEVAWLVASVPLGFVVSCLLVAALKRLALSRIAPGTYPIESAIYLRKWFSDSLMRLSRGVLLPLYTTLYLPPWLRLLGARIGARAELSTVWNFAPELIDVGEESFFADGSIVGGRRAHLGRFAVALNRIGKRSFVGNSAVLPVGQSLGDRCLLGVQSVPPDQACTADGTEWLGSPAFSLPRRPRAEGFADAVTFRPTARLWVQRALIDALRIVIPGYILLAVGSAGALGLDAALRHLGVLGMFAVAPGIALAMGLAAVLAVVGLKRLVMGTFAPVIRPLWSMYVWLNEMVNGAYESVMAPALMPLLGTPFVAPLLRLIGCRIGKHTYIETTLFSEFDLVEVGDYAALNAGAVIQNHLFEDRVMKSSHLKIGPECAVGNMAVVLYDAEMQRGSTLGPLSLLMKGETLSAGGRWHGVPCMQEGGFVALASGDK